MSFSKFTLKNGMQVVLEEDHSSPVVSLNVVIRAGSAMEETREWGIAHVIEHMLFKGTPTRGVGTIAREVEAAGGEINAYTSIDHTLYYINMASQFAKKGLSILSDTVKNPLFDQGELDREKEVIIEEIRRSKDLPSSRVSENLFKLAFGTHPFGHPVIGTERHVRSFKRKDLISFFKKWYTPQFMSIVIVGDFNTKQMLQLLEREFRTLTKKAASPEPHIMVPPHRKIKIHTESSNIQNTHMTLGYHIPEIRHEDVPALDILSFILGGSDSSRLEQEIKEKRQLVHQISSGTYTPRFCGQFMVSAVLRDAETQKVIQAIGDEISRISTQGISQSELSRAKLNLQASQIYDKETVGGQASKLAYFLATTGSADFERDFFQRLHSVTDGDVRSVCQKYLQPKNSAISILTPNGSRWNKAKATLNRTLARSYTPPKSSSVQSADTKPEVIRLKNGMTLVCKEIHKLPIVSLGVFGKGGLRFENAHNNGISMLTARALTKGTKNLSAMDIAQKSEMIAGSIDGIAGRNSIGIKCEFLSSFLNDGFDLFADIVANPSFAEDEVEKEKAMLLQEIKDHNDMLHSKAFDAALKNLFPDHPYGLPVIGKKKSVTSLTPASLKKFFFNSIRKRDLVIVAVGDITSHSIEDLIEEKLKGIPSGHIVTPKIPVEPPLTGIKLVEEEVDEKEQAHMVIAFPGTTMFSADRFPLTVLNSVLTGQGGKLFQTLRDKMGLAYSIFSTTIEGVDAGLFAIYIGTEPAKLEKAKSGILNELKLLLKNGVTKTEVARAKQYIAGTYSLDLQKQSGLATRYAMSQLYELGVENVKDYPKKIMAVKSADINAVIEKYINLDSYVMSIVKPGN
ncbi:MAG: pitrilysin family protein [Pseudomonadota bacterium]